MTDLADRYGAPRLARRRFLIGLVAVLAAAALGWLAWAAIYQSTPEVQSEPVGYHVVDEHTATATFTVVRDSPTTVATCFLRAIAEDHTIVGEATLVVDDGPRSQRPETTLRTERRATTVELLGCTAPGQPQRN